MAREDNTPGRPLGMYTGHIGDGGIDREGAMIGLARGTVQVVPHEAAWARLFAAEAATLRAALGEPATPIEHVGSTAIKGMDAKPIIDLMLAVPSLASAAEHIPVLENLGYEDRGDGGAPGRLFLAKGPPSRRTHHLSLAEPTSAFWRETLLFRDYLSTHPEAVEAYRRLKHDLAVRYPSDRAAYTNGKNAFIKGIIVKAGEEHS
jgi:GrpB-like predicted nucleotidyltransferase (UPF0157 family)